MSCLRTPPSPLASEAAEQRKGAISILMYLLAIPLAFERPYLALADVALVTLLWIIPTLVFGILAFSPRNRSPKDRISPATPRATH